MASGAMSVASPASDLNGDSGPSSNVFVGRVRIAPRALRTVVCEAALSVKGVVRLYSPNRGWVSSLGRPLPHAGVGLMVRGNTLGADLYIVTVAGAHMVEIGEAIQAAVSAAIEHILGMDVGEINVYIRDVD